MEPIATYEREGFFGGVVFTNGHLVDGNELTLYYGASDSVVCGARFPSEKYSQHYEVTMIDGSPDARQP